MEIFGAVVTCLVVGGFCMWAFCYIGGNLDTNGLGVAALACVSVCMVTTFVLLCFSFSTRINEIRDTNAPAPVGNVEQAEKSYVPHMPPKPSDHGKDRAT